MSVKIEFNTTRPIQHQNECREQQKKSLPSRDRTAGLKISIQRQLLFQLQSCALPAELRRGFELSCSRDDGKCVKPNIYFVYKLILFCLGVGTSRSSGTISGHSRRPHPQYRRLPMLSKHSNNWLSMLSQSVLDAIVPQQDISKIYDGLCGVRSKAATHVLRTGSRSNPNHLEDILLCNRPEFLGFHVLEACRDQRFGAAEFARGLRQY
jgi:hypothetical protein